MLMPKLELCSASSEGTQHPTAPQSTALENANIVRCCCARLPLGLKRAILATEPPVALLVVTLLKKRS